VEGGTFAKAHTWRPSHASRNVVLFLVIGKNGVCGQHALQHVTKEWPDGTASVLLLFVEGEISVEVFTIKHRIFRVKRAAVRVISNSYARYTVTI
jgi:hypothetical protein